MSQLEDKAPLGKHLAVVISNPALIGVYATAFSLVVAFSYNLGYWSVFDVSFSTFPIQFWSVTDLVSASLWAAAPASLLSLLFLLVMTMSSRIPVDKLRRNPTMLGNFIGFALFIIAGMVIAIRDSKLGWQGWILPIAVLAAGLIAFGLTAMLRKQGHVTPSAEAWENRILFVTLSVIFLGYVSGFLESTEIVSGVHYMEMGPSDRFRAAAGLPATDVGPIKLLARSSAGYLLLAPDGKTIVFVRGESVQGAWFRQIDTGKRY
jgi:putative effector of murein hydrolase LrgA (UPF0299 family)